MPWNFFDSQPFKVWLETSVLEILMIETVQIPEVFLNFDESDFWEELVAS